MDPIESLTLRRAHASEAAEIASISRQQIEHGLTWRWTPTRVRRSIKDGQTTVLVASISGVLQGFAILKIESTTAHLLLFAVQPKMRRHGIGESMLKWLEALCIEAKSCDIRLEVRATNMTALQFYKKRGYDEVEQLAAYYDKQESAIVMSKRLGSPAGD